MKIPDRNTAGVPPGPDKTGGAQSHRTEQSQKSKAVHQKTSAGQAAQTQAEHSPDRVQISDLARALRAEDVNSPERTEKLNRLAAEISSDRYKVDSQALSKSMVDDMIRK